ncbi:MAG: SUF system NifU family Fe-S cluster assembly protein [candidate division Zixibacteria bacterium]|nr:SUF system NifU family Fe-S cluster assembly protein [candidate division Zixibacteria bacterium]
MNASLDDMYREIILEHYRSPRGKKQVARVDISSDGINPSCGDEIALRVEMNQGNLADIHVDCKGCAISVASASMLVETVKGKSFEDARRIVEAVRSMLKGEGIAPEIQDLGDLNSLSGVQKFPVRIKCALLAWVTLLEGMRNYSAGNGALTANISTEEEIA